MYKVTIDLFTLNKNCKVKFSVIMTNDIDLKTKYVQKVISKFSFKGNDYLKISPHPYVTIDISRTAGNKEWDPNAVLNLNKKDLYVFVSHLQKMFKVFSDEKNLFYYENYDGNNKLMCNKDIANQHIDKFYCNNKVVCMQPAVVDATDNDNAEYEGILMAINRYDNYVYLTYSEIDYLLYELKKIDIHNLTMSLINTALLYEKEETEQLTSIGTPQIVTEKEDEEIVDIKPSVVIENKKEIPDFGS